MEKNRIYFTSLLIYLLGDKITSSLNTNYLNVRQLVNDQELNYTGVASSKKGKLRRKSEHNRNRGSYRKIFMDFGANNGQSIVSFMKSHANVGIIDNPSNNQAQDGSGRSNDFMKSNSSLLASYENWEVYAIEPNTKYEISLEEVKKQVMSLNNTKAFHIFCNTAIGVYNGVGEFILDTTEGTGEAGSTLKSESRSAVGKKIPVEVIDVVTFFETERITEEDYVAVKVDIEGMEYELIRRMILYNTLRLVDKIAVEW